MSTHKDKALARREQLIRNAYSAMTHRIENGWHYDWRTWCNSGSKCCCLAGALETDYSIGKHRVYLSNVAALAHNKHNIKYSELPPLDLLLEQANHAADDGMQALSSITIQTATYFVETSGVPTLTLDEPELVD